MEALSRPQTPDRTVTGPLRNARKPHGSQPYTGEGSQKRRRQHETHDLPGCRRMPGHSRGARRGALLRGAGRHRGQLDAESGTASAAGRSALAHRRVLGRHAARGRGSRRGRLRHRAGTPARRHRGDAGHRAGSHGARARRAGHRRARARVHAGCHRPRPAYPPRGEEGAPPGRPDERPRRLRGRRPRALRREPPAPRRRGRGAAYRSIASFFRP